MHRAVPLLVAGLLVLAGCGRESPDPTVPAEHAGAGRVLRVPARYRTIQAAVDASQPGDLVLIAAGVYHEAVKVPDEHPRIVIRGLSRNAVVLDGQHGALTSGISVGADGVAVENLTIRDYAVNGLVFAPEGYGGAGRTIRGWRGSYITAYRNGLYGVYAFQAVRGVFDHIYASGHPDSGIYVGQCRDCQSVVTDSVVTENGVGFEDTNASGLVVTGVTSRANRIGVLLNSASKERLAPQRDVVVAGNRVIDNDNRAAPTADQGFGSAIVITGGDDNRVTRNLIAGHAGAGVVIVDAAPRNGGFPATNNRVTANRLRDNGLDLALLTSPASNGNCFAGNHPARTVPARLEQRVRCGRSVGLGSADARLPANPAPPSGSQGTPPPQRSMPAAARALPRPATGTPPAVDVSAIGVPRG